MCPHLSGAALTVSWPLAGQRAVLDILRRSRDTTNSSNRVTHTPCDCAATVLPRLNMHTAGLTLCVRPATATTVLLRRNMHTAGLPATVLPRRNVLTAGLPATTPPLLGTGVRGGAACKCLSRFRRFVRQLRPAAAAHASSPPRAA
eukprot:358772-Chlamydomonas_euryale.AAC.22